MMALMGFVIFTAALTASMAVFAFTLIPAMPRIMALLSGEQIDDTQIVTRLVLREGRARPSIPALQRVPVRVHRAVA